ncbi:hypothetical protein MATR_06780 [Marivirga tractuosa]|uniref:DUF1772 domain-containing protein n=1 Tax=Marivirga tractuosa (strain ATCC 23168 / DSM 4126 / NBRC 15989 / NCIMB 1408 / VKM B-1430 / H-43) TaxID=643867 RepID=E4TQY9_MARTH|nr:DUF1772 domain-containing protein [Marivirga tractuosa]ADR21689.1 hypothetical protein Ftrac_1701 [Marivirga tractuosa DSM 4126]BDD13853.1 hypothetical protein MATR_06780 [Marivirga tractuosa]
MISETLLLLSTWSLRIFLGAQIAEGCLIVPYWKKLSPEEFFDFFSTNGYKLKKFYAPLTIIATLSTLCVVAFFIFKRSEELLIVLVMGSSTLCFFSTYFVFFKNANESFSEKSISHKDLASELRRWGNWHWTRVAFESIAFVLSLVLLLKS